MTFPFASKGEVIIDEIQAAGLSAPDALARLALALKKRRPTSLEFDDREVRFRTELIGHSAPPFGVFWGIDRGTVAISQGGGTLRLTYALSLRRFFLMMTIPMLVILGLTVANSDTAGSGLSIFTLLAWALVFGGNYLIAVGRFRELITGAFDQRAA